MPEIKLSLTAQLCFRGRITNLLLESPNQWWHQTILLQLGDRLRHLLQATICLCQLITQRKQDISDIRRFGPGDHGNHGQIQRDFIKVRLDKTLESGQTGLAQKLLSPGKVRPKALLLQAKLVKNDGDTVRMEGT